MFGFLARSRAALGVLAFALSGCTNLLGDFAFDPNAGSSGVQGDIVVMPVDGLITTEQGAKATFSIVLKREPTDVVAIALSSSNPAEGRVSPNAVNFTTDNWAAPQQVQITGVNDDLPDGPQSYTIKTSRATSGDPSYYNIDPVDPKVTNVDDDTAGFTLLPTSGLTTTESGGEATFTLSLNHTPTADVIVPLSSERPDEGTVSPASLTFTALNWMAPQVVTVSGVDDDKPDGDQMYHVITGQASSADSAYDKLDPPDPLVTNQDNDRAGIVLTPPSGLTTTEQGGMASFGIALSAPPTSDVAIALSSSDISEGSVTPARVVFTPLNWMAPQIVTVTGVDDDRADGNQPYRVVTAPAESEDQGYAQLDGPDAELLNIDDDTPSLIVTPTLGLVTTEDGSSATFSVQLASKPMGNAILNVTSGRPTEGVATPASLTFTERNWNAPQLVTVSGVDDLIADGTQPYVVHVTPSAESSDPLYAALLETDVNLMNVDDDSAGITIMAAPGLTTTEGGGAATFTVNLNSHPTANVTIPLSSNNPAEGTVSPSSLVFTPDNYKAPQLVTVTGANDDAADGNQPYRIVTEAAVSDDLGYQGMNAANVDLTNLDDDSAGIWVNAPNQPLYTSEGGGTTNFSVVLTSQPDDSVTIPVSSSNPAEGVVNVSALLFTRMNWRAPQVVTVKGVDDDGSADGAQPYTVKLGQPQTTDAKYAAIDPPDVQLRNTDNDSPGISLRNASNLATSEAGGMASFQIVLNSKPKADVSIALSSSRTTEGTVTPASLTFTGANWAAPQTVTIKGVDDAVADGSQTYRVVIAAAVSNDPQYSGIDAPDVNVQNIDNDSPGISVVQSGVLSTSESGSTATFSVELNSQPTADVIIPLRSSLTSEGTVSPAQLTFTSANWSAPHIVTVTGVNDDVADGAQPYRVILDPAQSADAQYNGRDAPDVMLTNVDNDSAGITVSPPSGNTKEPNGSATFTVVLNSKPTKDVKLSITSDNIKEGTVSPSSLTFTSVNWAAPQKVTVTGADDAIADGAQTYTIVIAPAVSQDPGYNGIDAPDVALSNIDDDSAGISVSPLQGATGEDGTTASFTISLNSQPTADVTIKLSSSNPAEGTLAISQLVFTKADYASPKTVTVTGVDDDAADGNQRYFVVLGAATSADKGYAGMDAPDVSVINIDDDSAGLSVSPLRGTTGEKPTFGSFMFTISLTSKPSADVTIPLTSSNTKEGRVTPPKLTFTSANWKAGQTVTVTGVDDDVADGPQTYGIQIGAATSSDPGYSGLDWPEDVAMTNIDDDSAAILVSQAAGFTSEGGLPTTFSIVLTSQPTGSVTIPLSSSRETEGSPSVSQVVFSTSNWNAPQTVTVYGENDEFADGDQMYSIITGPATSSDANYNLLDPDDVALINVDDDVAGFSISSASGPTDEDGKSAKFTVVLNSKPTGTVSIPVSSSNDAEGTADVARLDFTTNNWSTPQTVTVTGVDDSVADGTQSYTIKLGKPTTSDPGYAVLDPNDVTLLNEDNDTAGLKVGPPSGTSTGEAMAFGDVTFSIVLRSKPSANVTIPLASSLPSEGDISSPGSRTLVFTPSDWNQAQMVTVTGVDDSLQDGDQPYSIRIGPTASGDPAYDGLVPSDLMLLNIDDD
jgi:hypothetical protein